MRGFFGSGLRRLDAMAFKPKLLLCVTAMMIALTAGLVVTYATKQSAYIQDRASSELRVGLELLYHDLRYDFSGLSRADTADGIRIIWRQMPRVFADDRADGTSAATGLVATIFRFDAETREFVREATTVQTASGERAVGTLLARGPVYDAMLANRQYFADAVILGRTYHAIYQPVLDPDGQPVGILFLGIGTGDLTATLWWNVSMFIGIALVLTGVALAVLHRLLGMLLAPLVQTNRELSALADGDLSRVIGGTDRSDEFGGVARGLLVLQASMRQAEAAAAEQKTRDEAERVQQNERAYVVETLSHGLTELAALRLTAEITSTADRPYPAEYDHLRQSFNALVQEFAATIHSIRASAEMVHQGASEMALASNDLSQRTESQAATLEETSAALAQLRDSVKSAAEHAGGAERQMVESRAVAERTRDVVDSAIGAMGRIRESSSRIERIVTVIDEIAFQTNLLALNAGVEAARAGDAGKGFAVVASEVRSLAQRSAESAREIAQLISTSRDEVSGGHELVAQTGRAVSEILTHVDATSKAMSDIAQGARDQAIAIAEVSEAMQQLDSTTQNNAAMAEEAAAASAQLGETAQGLSETVGRFHIGDIGSQTRRAHTDFMGAARALAAE